MNKEYAQYLLEKTCQDYNLISEHFSSSRFSLWPELKILRECAKEGEKILDLGCGNGRLLELFKDKNIEYVGIDNSEKLIAIAKKLHPDAKFQVADALGLPFPSGYFDKIYSIAVLHHIPSKELRLQFLKEAERVLKPGGFLILTVWNLWQKRTAWRLFFKYTTLKLIGKSELDFKDIFYPWKEQSGVAVIQRYFHLFTKKEIGELAEMASFKIKEIGILKRKEEKDSNIYIIAEKFDKKENVGYNSTK